MSRLNKKTKTTTEKRLFPLIAFLRIANLTRQDVADQLGVSRIAVNRYFSQDDVKLSTFQRILAAYGCSLRIRLTPNSPGHVLIDEKAIEKLNPNNPKQLLWPLMIEMARTGYSAKDLAIAVTRLGHPTKEANIYNYLTKDDMMVSKLYIIAEALDVTIDFIIEPKE